MLKVDPFDSELFGGKAGKFTAGNEDVDIDEIIQECEEGGFETITLFIKSTRANLENLFRNGFKFIGTKVEYSSEDLGYDGSSIEQDGAALTERGTPYMDDLLRLSEIVGKKSRYYFDSDNPDVWREAYKKWVINSVDERADEIAVAISEEENRVVGFLFLIEEEEEMKIDLLVVDPEFAQKGIGAKLVEEAFLSAKENGKKRVVVVTESDNITAQRIYQKAGMRITDSTNIFIKHMNNGK